MDKYRFNQTFMQAVIALGCAAVGVSLYYWQRSQPVTPILVLALAAMTTSFVYSVPVPGGLGRVSLLDTFVLLALLLFGGESAILFAAVSSASLSARHGRDLTRVLFDAAASAVAALLAVWTLRFIFGSVIEPGHTIYSLTFFQALFLAALIQAAASAAVTVLGESYKIQQSVWSKRGTLLLWTIITHLAGAVGACLVAQLISGIGDTAFIASAATASIIIFAYGQNLTNTKAEAAPPTYGGSLKESPERFRSAFDHAAIGMTLVSPEGRWLQVNRSLCGLLGYTERELMETDYLKVIHPNDLSAALASIKDLMKGKVQSCQIEKRYVHKQGHAVWALWSASLARDSFSKSPHLIFQIQNITDRKEAEERLLHDAFHDALTGLPNRALLMDHLKLALARSQRNDKAMFAVIYLDLDRFKVINDSLGHMIGDQLLVGIARRLENSLRPGDTIARLGGDEFTVLLEDIQDRNYVVQIAERIQQELSSPFSLSGREVFTTVSIGIAISSKEYQQTEDILRDADTAMYRAKALGKARYEIFDKGMHDRATKLLQLETDLRRAMERDEFFVFYQPIMSLETGGLRGFEALVRWRHPEQGFISPSDFIPVAEETGMIVQIGEYVLREACRQMRQWEIVLPSDPPLFISVNLSVKQFSQPNLVERVAAILRETRLDPKNLKLEITESAVMENVETATEMLSRLRNLGLRISMDDFGTGYSSLSHLRRFPIDTLKIDRSFVTQMGDDEENAEIVRTIVGLAQNLGMDVVAEGVETPEQVETLTALGCEYGQGYFFSKPLDYQRAEQYICETYSPLATVLDDLVTGYDARLT
ncbi:MAG TPA: EAL domain-containing protein [Pyrinomonadaceae bacterium]|nr:EAL domain-containing protein [Pyrinomonadaceae bacterium]